MKAKQRAELKKQSHDLPISCIMGKQGLSESFLEEVSLQLDAHELIKIQILDNAQVDTKETANAICKELDAEFVQAIGKKAVIYRENPEKKERKGK